MRLVLLGERFVNVDMYVEGRKEGRKELVPLFLCPVSQDIHQGKGFRKSGLKKEVVPHLGGLSSGWVFIGWGGLSSKWSFIRQGGLSSAGSFITQGGLTSKWSFIRVSFHQTGLSCDHSLDWYFFRVVFYKSVWSSFAMAFRWDDNISSPDILAKDSKIPVHANVSSPDILAQDSKIPMYDNISSS